MNNLEIITFVLCTYIGNSDLFIVNIIYSAIIFRTNINKFRYLLLFIKIVVKRQLTITLILLLSLMFIEISHFPTNFLFVYSFHKYY